MRFDRWATLYVAQPLRATGLKSDRRYLPILMYHSISHGTEERTVSPYYRTTTSPEKFAAQMDFLQENGWRGVTTSDGMRSLRNEASSGGNIVVITFDDGFADFREHAVPAMQKHGFAATMYLPTAFIGETAREFKGHNCLTWTQVRELREAGMEFGSHTVNHPILVDCEWGQISRELEDSKREIEQRLGVEAPAFAYPYAFPQTDREFGGRFRDLLGKFGYESCVTTAIGRATSLDDPLMLKRLPANSEDDEDLLRAKLNGAYDWLHWPQTAVKSLKAVLRG